MTSNTKFNTREEVIEFLENFLQQEGFEEISIRDQANADNLTIEDPVTHKRYSPTISARKGEHQYLFQVETEGQYSKERIQKWKQFVKYAEERSGAFCLFVPSIYREVFIASLRQHKLDGQVQVIQY